MEILLWKHFLRLKLLNGQDNHHKTMINNNNLLEIGSNYELRNFFKHLKYNHFFPNIRGLERTDNQFYYIALVSAFAFNYFHTNKHQTKKQTIKAQTLFIFPNTTSFVRLH
jgi:hypothetical protein